MHRQTCTHGSATGDGTRMSVRQYIYHRSGPGKQKYPEGTSATRYTPPFCCWFLHGVANCLVARVEILITVPCPCGPLEAGPALRGNAK